jgi:hypothetical protein
MPVPKNITADIYYKHPNYWLKNGQSIFIELGRTDTTTILKQRCEAAGLKPTKKEIREAFARIAEDQSINCVSPCLPGYPIGLIPGKKTLVPEALKPIEPKKGQCPLIDEILVHLLAKKYPKQLEYFNGWLASGFRCLQNNICKPGQVLFLVGPQNAGKTLVQDEIITPIFGGAKADPYRYVTGRSQFNLDLCRVMHLMMSDVKDPKSRQEVRESIRQIASNNFESLHGKGKDAFVESLLWRMSISCNEAEDDLKIVPPLEGLEDKVMLFRCAYFALPRPTTPPEKYKLFQDELRAELPAYLYSILAKPIDPDLVHPRFDIKGYINPELVPMIRQLDQEEKALDLVRDHKRATSTWTTPFIPTDLTAGEIHEELFRQDNLKEALRRIAVDPRTLGKLLRKLVERNDNIVTSRLLNGEVLYTFKI